MKKAIAVAMLLLFAESANTETFKKMIISMPLRAEWMKPLFRCDWSKEFPVDMVCEVYVPSNAGKAEAIMQLNPTVWTETEWKKIVALQRANAVREAEAACTDGEGRHWAARSDGMCYAADKP